MMVETLWVEWVMIAEAAEDMRVLCKRVLTTNWLGGVQPQPCMPPVADVQVSTAHRQYSPKPSLFQVTY